MKIYFFAGAGAGCAGAGAGVFCGAGGTGICTWLGAGADFAGCRSKIVLPPPPVFLVASIDNDIDVNINRIAEIVVAFDSSVADPRGPNAVCEPMPPNAPARSAALPLCRSTTTIRKRHTTTCTNTKR